jgi:hypothetical protein
VLPTAISLKTVKSFQRERREQNIPHTSEKLDKTSIAVGKSNNDAGRTDASCVDVDQRQNEGGKSESRETKRRRVGELAVWWAVETRLEFTTEGSKAKFGVVGSNVRKRVASIVVWPPLSSAVGAVVRIVDTAGLLVDAGAALRKVSYEFVNKGGADHGAPRREGPTGMLLCSCAVAISTVLDCSS